MLWDTKQFLSDRLNMKDLAVASYVLGIKTNRDWSAGRLGLSQRAYIDKVL